MSIEQALAELTAAVKENTSAIRSIQPARPAQSEELPAPSSTESAPAPRRGRKASATPPESGTVASPGTAPPAQAPVSAPVASPSVTEKSLGAAVLDLAEHYSHPKAVEILEKYGVRRVGQLKTEQFPAVLKDVTAAIEELKAKSAAPAAPASLV